MRIVSKRQLPEVSEEVRRTPAPTVPTFESPYGARLVDPDSDDPERIASWMQLPHLVETWEQPWSVEEWRADSIARLSSSYSLPFILTYDFAAIGRPEDGVQDIGYFELYRVAKDECALLYDADPHDIGFHIATASPALTGRGIVSEWMAVLARSIWSAEPRCRRIIGDPDFRNIRVRRALEKRGWRDLGEVDVRPDRRIALYVLPRHSEDLPHLRPGMQQ